MTEPLDVLILNSLMGQLKGAATSGFTDLTSPATPLASPLVAFTPTADVAYIDARPVMRAAPSSPPLGFVAYVKYSGIFQVDAVSPDGKGEATGLRLASLVAARFAMGTVLLAGSNKVQFIYPSTIAAAVKDAPWVRYPVSIPYLVLA